MTNARGGGGRQGGGRGTGDGRRKGGRRETKRQKGTGDGRTGYGRREIVTPLSLPPPHMLVHYNFLPPIQKLITVLVLYSVADLLASLLSAPE